MVLALQETGRDHRGRELLDGLCACIRRDTGEVVGFKARWLQEDGRGRRRQPSKSFSVRKLGSLDRALDAATFFLAGVREASRASQGGTHPDSGCPTANEVFAEWVQSHGAELSPDYVERMDRFWKREIAPRSIGQIMGFTVAARPSEWRLTATWADIHDETVELQRPSHRGARNTGGLKRGAHVALLLQNAHDRLITYRQSLEDRFGPQPDDGLVFQVLGADGPIWTTSQDGSRVIPVAWTTNAYNQWVRRVWAPARLVASRAPDAPAGLEQMTLYDCRHTAISMALHSTMVVGPLGMNLHPLAAWAAHDIETLQRYYRHLIARYLNKPPIDLQEECSAARAAVEEKPFRGASWCSSQRPAQRRRRARVQERKLRKRLEGTRIEKKCPGPDSNRRLPT
jgi:hypothetical protein